MGNARTETRVQDCAPAIQVGLGLNVANVAQEPPSQVMFALATGHAWMELGTVAAFVISPSADSAVVLLAPDQSTALATVMATAIQMPLANANLGFMDQIAPGSVTVQVMASASTVPTGTVHALVISPSMVRAVRPLALCLGTPVSRILYPGGRRPSL